MLSPLNDKWHCSILYMQVVIYEPNYEKTNIVRKVSTRISLTMPRRLIPADTFRLLQGSDLALANSLNACQIQKMRVEFHAHSIFFTFFPSSNLKYLKKKKKKKGLPLSFATWAMAIKWNKWLIKNKRAQAVSHNKLRAKNSITRKY